MMGWYGYGAGAGGWVAMMFGMAFFGVLILIVVAIVIFGANRNRLLGAPRGRDADAILDERFARGEIDRDEYEERKAALHADGRRR